MFYLFVTFSNIGFGVNLNLGLKLVGLKIFFQIIYLVKIAENVKET